MTLDICCKIVYVYRVLLHVYGGALHRYRLRKSNPVMETYGIPRDEVIELINLDGGRVVDIQRDKSVGEAWISYRYYITK